MAINKQKVLETAQRFVEKGQTDKAIKEFLKIVEEDPRDVRIWLKIGDLYARKGAKAEATQTYQRVAEFYGEQGFYLKAVAVYKQILKLDPRLVEINLKLADVYRKLGLLSDAIQQYEVVAAFYHREGKTKDALATIRELCELDPENVATRIKLAELYSKEGMTGSAVVEFGRAADHLRVQGRTEDFIKVAERLVWHQPDNVPVNRELARLYLQRNDPRHALQKLQACFKSDPRDVDTLELLASAFLALGQRSKTVSVWREIAHVHQEAGRLADAGNTFRKVLSVEPADPEALAAAGGAPAIGTGTHGAAPSPAQKRFMTTGAIDIYGVAAVGSEPLVESPFADAPGEPTFDIEQRPTGQAARPDDPYENDELGTLVRETRPAGDTSDIELAVDELGELGDDTLMQDAHAEQLGKILDEADVYVKYGLTPKAIAHLQRVFDIDPRNVEARERLKDIYAGLEQREQAANELVKLVDLVAPVNADQAEAYLRELIAFDGDEGRARTLATRHRLRVPDLRAPGEPRDDTSGAVPLDADDVLVELSAGHDAMEYSLDDIGEEREDFAPTDGTMEVESGQVVSDEMELDDAALEEMVADAEERTVDAALDFADLGDAGSREFAVDPADAAVSESLGGEPEGDVGAELDALQSGRVPTAQPSVLRSPTGPTGIEDDLDEAEFYVSQGLWQEARDLLLQLADRHPGHPLVAAKLRDVEAMAKGPSPQAPAPAPKPKVIAKGMGDEDSETHYDLGVAYKEMQLFDEAIREFELVRNAPGKTVQCHLMIGLCQAQRGRWDDAVKEYKRGLYVESITEREALALYYELGASYEAMGDPREALYYFEKVQKRDPRFHDAHKRADRLRATGARARPDDGDDTIFEGGASGR